MALPRGPLSPSTPLLVPPLLCDSIRRIHASHRRPSVCPPSCQHQSKPAIPTAGPMPARPPASSRPGVPTPMPTA